MTERERELQTAELNYHYMIGRWGALDAVANQAFAKAQEAWVALTEARVVYVEILKAEIERAATAAH